MRLRPDPIVERASLSKSTMQYDGIWDDMSSAQKIELLKSLR
jgi:hypothetical protein